MVHYVDVDEEEVIHISRIKLDRMIEDACNSVKTGEVFEIQYRYNFPEHGASWEQLKLDI